MTLDWTNLKKLDWAECPYPRGSFIAAGWHIAMQRNKAGIVPAPAQGDGAAVSGTALPVNGSDRKARAVRFHLEVNNDDAKDSIARYARALVDSANADITLPRHQFKFEMAKAADPKDPDARVLVLSITGPRMQTLGDEKQIAAIIRFASAYAPDYASGIGGHRQITQALQKTSWDLRDSSGQVIPARITVENEAFLREREIFNTNNRPVAPAKDREEENERIVAEANQFLYTSMENMISAAKICIPGFMRPASMRPLSYERMPVVSA